MSDSLPPARTGPLPVKPVLHRLPVPLVPQPAPLPWQPVHPDTGAAQHGGHGQHGRLPRHGRGRGRAPGLVAAPMEDWPAATTLCQRGLRGGSGGGGPAQPRPPAPALAILPVGRGVRVPAASAWRARAAATPLPALPAGPDRQPGLAAVGAAPALQPASLGDGPGQRAGLPGPGGRLSRPVPPRIHALPHHQVGHPGDPRLQPRPQPNL